MRLLWEGVSWLTPVLMLICRGEVVMVVGRRESQGLDSRSRPSCSLVRPADFTRAPCTLQKGLIQRPPLSILAPFSASFATGPLYVIGKWDLRVLSQQRQCVSPRWHRTWMVQRRPLPCVNRNQAPLRLCASLTLTRRRVERQPTRRERGVSRVWRRWVEAELNEKRLMKTEKRRQQNMTEVKSRTRQ